MSDLTDRALQMYDSISQYCETYNVPIENLLDILEDQKVLPMIRGKATEYIGAAVLRQNLDPRDWSVEKLNLNPQSSTRDEDISITYRRTGVRFSAETKNAVRGSFRLQTRQVPYPHFKVKCHRSRSNFTKRYNDRYMADEFDVLLCNVSNAIFQGGSQERGLQLLHNQEAIAGLKNHYQIDQDSLLIRSTYDDWRICFPKDIALPDGTIPRTPVVLMQNDPNWFGINEMGTYLLKLIS